MMQSKNRKVLAILGGPHKNGVTAKMLKIAVDACEKRGDEVTVLHLYDKNISFCKGCRKCMETKECIIKDDMVEITGLIKQCDLLILSTPVFWANVPAAVKNMFDRMWGAAMEETKTFPKPRLLGKQYMILTSCNTPMPFARIFGQTTGAIRAMKEFFKTAGMKNTGIVVCADAINRKEIPTRVRTKIERMV